VVAFLCWDTQKRQACDGTGSVEERIAVLPMLPLVAGVVKLDGHLRFKPLLVAQQQVQVFAVDPVAVALGLIGPAFNIEDVGKPDLEQDHVVFRCGLKENPVECLLGLG